MAKSLKTSSDDASKKENSLYIASLRKDKKGGNNFTAAISIKDFEPLIKVYPMHLNKMSSYSSRVLSWRRSSAAMATTTHSTRSSAGSAVGMPTGPYYIPNDPHDDLGVPVDFLEGKMDLRVVMPDGIGGRSRAVSMYVEGKTPMLYLLVLVTTANRLSPGDFVIQVMNERSDHFLYYKPSTPIGKCKSGCRNEGEILSRNLHWGFLRYSWARCDF